jgi:hypothetical protein
MTKIKKLIEDIEDELCGAKDYAEKYIEYKVKNDSTKATKYKEMANDELKHAMYIHDFAIHKIDELSKVYTPPVNMVDEWEHEHREYVEKSAWIKQMLAM